MRCSETMTEAKKDGGCSEHLIYHIILVHKEAARGQTQLCYHASNPIIWLISPSSVHLTQTTGNSIAPLAFVCVKYKQMDQKRIFSYWWPTTGSVCRCDTVTFKSTGIWRNLLHKTTTKYSMSEHFQTIWIKSCFTIIYNYKTTLKLYTIGMLEPEEMIELYNGRLISERQKKRGLELL